MGLFSTNKKDNFNYSDSFIKKASDEELSAEREKVRVKRNSSYDCDIYESYDRILRRLDKELGKRMNEKYNKEHPNKQPVHREHGWYLPNDD